MRSEPIGWRHLQTGELIDNARMMALRETNPEYNPVEAGFVQDVFAGRQVPAFVEFDPRSDALVVNGFKYAIYTLAKGMGGPGTVHIVESASDGQVVLRTLSREDSHLVRTLIDPRSRQTVYRQLSADPRMRPHADHIYDTMRFTAPPERARWAFDELRYAVPPGFSAPSHTLPSDARHATAPNPRPQPPQDEQA